MLERSVLKTLANETEPLTTDQWRGILDLVLIIANQKKVLPEYFGKILTLHHAINDTMYGMDGVYRAYLHKQEFEALMKKVDPKAKTTVRKKPKPEEVQELQSGKQVVLPGIEPWVNEFRRLRLNLAAEFALIVQCPPPDTILS